MYPVQAAGLVKPFKKVIRFLRFLGFNIGYAQSHAVHRGHKKECDIEEGLHKDQMDFTLKL